MRCNAGTCWENVLKGDLSMQGGRWMWRCQSRGSSSRTTWRELSTAWPTTHRLRRQQARLPRSRSVHTQGAPSDQPLHACMPFSKSRLSAMLLLEGLSHMCMGAHICSSFGPSAWPLRQPFAGDQGQGNAGWHVQATSMKQD